MVKLALAVAASVSVQPTLGCNRETLLTSLDGSTWNGQTYVVDSQTCDWWGNCFPNWDHWSIRCKEGFCWDGWTTYCVPSNQEGDNTICVPQGEIGACSGGCGGISGCTVGPAGRCDCPAGYCLGCADRGPSKGALPGQSTCPNGGSVTCIPYCWEYHGGSWHWDTNKPECNPPEESECASFSDQNSCRPYDLAYWPCHWSNGACSTTPGGGSGGGSSGSGGGSDAAGDDKEDDDAVGGGKEDDDAAGDDKEDDDAVGGGGKDDEDGDEEGGDKEGDGDSPAEASKDGGSSGANASASNLRASSSAALAFKAALFVPVAWQAFN